MDINNLLESLREAILAGDQEQAEVLAKQSVNNSVDPQKIIEEGIRIAMDDVGERFSTGEYFLPDLVLSGEATKAIINVLEPLIKSKGKDRDVSGKIVIGTVKGDIHEIGKTLVGTMLTGAGFNVLDLGVDVPAEKFVGAAKEKGVEVIGLSALLTTTMPYQKVVIDALKEADLRKKIKIIIGGAPTNVAWAEEIGADAYCDNAMEAVRVVRKLIRV